MAKFDNKEVDESFVMASIKKNKKPETIPVVEKTETAEEPVSTAEPIMIEEPVTILVQQEAPKEETRRKRSNRQDYESLFIKESTVTARLGKTVYIRKEFHDRILKIVQVIGGNEVSLFSYIDNVLANHFESFQDEITQAYNQKNGSIF